MNIFSVIFSTVFVILGAFVWIVAMLIIITGAIGVLRVVVRQVFEVDIIEWLRRDREEKQS